MGRKCEVFDSKQTNWIGLWYHPEYNGYSSSAFSMAALKAFKGPVRVYMRKNKLYEQGSNRPNYCFCIKDADSETFQEVEVTDEKQSLRDKVDELRDIMIEGRMNGDLAMLPSESQARAQELMREAVELIEEITGEKWEFSYITF